MKRSLIAALAAIALCLAALTGLETARFVTASPQLSAEAIAKPMEPVSVEPSWITAGSPRFSQVEIARSPDGRTTSGLWACEGPGTFEWRFAVDEVVYILEGEVAITYKGSEFVLRPGDTATFHGGTTATWRVDSYLKKAYSLHNPGPIGRLWRSVFPAS